MSIFNKKTALGEGFCISGPELLIKAVRGCGMIPFFESPIPGYSVEEMTPSDHWFDSETLGPWDWKIDAVQTGNIAYGKFLWNGKAAFASADCYRDLLNYRRSLPKYSLKESDRQAYEAVCRAGTLTSRELRRICGLKKAQMDAILTRLQQQTLLVIGDFERVYKGEFLTYEGWQLASFCRPEDLFEYDLDGPYRSPAESRQRLVEIVLANAPHATQSQIDKMLG